MWQVHHVCDKFFSELHSIGRGCLFSSITAWPSLTTSCIIELCIRTKFQRPPVGSLFLAECILSCLSFPLWMPWSSLAKQNCFYVFFPFHSISGCLFNSMAFGMSCDAGVTGQAVSEARQLFLLRQAFLASPNTAGQTKTMGRNQTVSHFFL